MSAAATLERVELLPVRSSFDDGATLEDTILGAWDELVSGGCCACPVCGEALVAGIAGVAGGACARCGSELR